MHETSEVGVTIGPGIFFGCIIIAWVVGEGLNKIAKAISSLKDTSDGDSNG